MFYATTIKSVGGGGAVDVQGRHLSFIGYLPVKEGDTVYTDGRYIFGNAPPKGSPAVFDTPSGIPVLGDEYSLSTSDPKEELRGYVNKSGKYKRFKIAGDEWTTNAKKTYAHDGSIDGVDDANVIDAEIALDENGAEDGVYTVEKIVNEVGTDDTNEIFYMRDGNGRIFGDINIINTLLNQGILSYTYNRVYGDKFSRYYQQFYIHFDDADYAMKDDDQLKKCELILRKDGVEIERINLADFAASFEAEAKQYVAIEIPNREPEDHIRTRIMVDNFRILPDGKWEAIFTIEVIAERTFTAENLVWQQNGKIDIKTESETVPITAETVLDEETYGSLARIGNAFINQFDNLTRPRSITMTNWEFTIDDSMENGAYSVFMGPSVYTTATAYYRKVDKETSTTFAHCVYTLKIKSSETEPQILIEKIFLAPLLFFDAVIKRIDDSGWQYTKSIPLQKHGGVNVYPYNPYGDLTGPISYDRDAMKADVLEEFDIKPDEDGNFLFPKVDTTTYSYAAGESWVVYVTQLIGGAEERGYNLHGVYFCNLVLLYDSRNLPNAPDYDNPVEEIADDFSFPVQDDFTATIESWQDETPAQDETFKPVYWKLGGIYDKDSKRVVDGSDEKISGDVNDGTNTDDETAHQWNMSLATLKSGDYLFGIRDDQDRDIDGKLFKIDGKGKVEETFAEHGFKNFRLRELKKISKAKK